MKRLWLPAARELLLEAVRVGLAWSGQEEGGEYPTAASHCLNQDYKKAAVWCC